MKLADNLNKALLENKDTAEAQELTAQLDSIGISNPVTKESAGSQFHRDLAVELARFLEQLLPRHNGIMTLFDVYCFFNRARGTRTSTRERWRGRRSDRG